MFSVLDWKYHFWTNLVQKIKIVSLSWTLASRLIWVSRIQWWFSLFLFYTRNTLFSKRSGIVVSVTWWSTDFFLFILFFNSFFLFCCGECVHGLVLGTAVRIFKLKRKQTFYFTWINFLLKKLSCQSWLNFICNMKHQSFANETQIELRLNC